MDPYSRNVLPGLTLGQQLDDIRAFENRLKNVLKYSRREQRVYFFIATMLMILWFVTFWYFVYHGGWKAVLRLEAVEIPTRAFVVVILGFASTIAFALARTKLFVSTDYLTRTNIVLRDFYMYFDTNSEQLISLKSLDKLSVEDELRSRWGFPPADQYRSSPSGENSPFSSSSFRGSPGSSMARLQAQWDERMRDSSHPGGPIGSPYAVGVSSS
eukprot:TRINITY_DN12756_c0_g1_i1.p1 TRINITY_DN12756_c0_g1~~TRINITY_DN12756_c0_g1_i1.p1  ORF type:complete len:214 (-),score=14.85 TRINITY_DN12756_c0_g1_i1:119-760(-)